MPDPLFRFATVQGQNIHWFLKRNCSVTPAQLGWLYASLCVVSLGTAAVFWFQGAVLILPFAWVELAAVGAAFAATNTMYAAVARRYVAAWPETAEKREDENACRGAGSEPDARRHPTRWGGCGSCGGEQRT